MTFDELKKSQIYKDFKEDHSMLAEVHVLDAVTTAITWYMNLPWYLLLLNKTWYYFLRPLTAVLVDAESARRITARILLFLERWQVN